MKNNLTKYISNPFSGLSVGASLALGLTLGIAFDNVALGLALSVFFIACK